MIGSFYRTAAVSSVLLALCTALSYRTCDSPIGKVNNMFIPGCEGASCFIRRGEVLPIHILFTPYRRVEKVLTEVYVKVFWFSINLTPDKPDACLYRLLPCPLTPGTSYEYIYNITIDSSSPSFSGDIRWELSDEEGNDVVCLEFAGGIH